MRISIFLYKVNTSGEVTNPNISWGIISPGLTPGKKTDPPPSFVKTPRNVPDPVFFINRLKMGTLAFRDVFVKKVRMPVPFGSGLVF
jgi:hypothetical protein